MKRSIVVSTLILLAGIASAATIRVPSQYPTIMAGVNAAVSGDTVLLADGLYTGAGNRGIDFGGRDIVLMSENGPHTCIIDCEYQDRGFYLHTGETSAAHIIGITIRNGFAFGGGGMCFIMSSPTVKNCIINDCQTPTEGAGILANISSAVFINCVLHNNAASSGGGVSAVDSDIHLNSCSLVANTSSG